jgi:hypothetical protein
LLTLNPSNPHASQIVGSLLFLTEEEGFALPGWVCSR